MAPPMSPFRLCKVTRGGLFRGLLAVLIAVSIGCGGALFAANQSITGVKKEEGAFEGDGCRKLLIAVQSLPGSHKGNCTNHHPEKNQTRDDGQQNCDRKIPVRKTRAGLFGTFPN